MYQCSEHMSPAFISTNKTGPDIRNYEIVNLFLTLLNGDERLFTAFVDEITLAFLNSQSCFSYFMVDNILH